MVTPEEGRVKKKTPIFHLYGDESSNDTIVTYGVVVVKPHKEQDVANIVKSIKSKYHIESERLHCAEIFHSSKRKKSEWNNLTPEECLSVYKELLLSVKKDLFFVGAVADRRNIPKEFPAQENDPKELSFDLHMDVKQITVFLASIIQEPFMKQLGPGSYEFWGDPDRTKIQWLNRRSQATRAIGGIYIMPIPGQPKTKINLIDEPVPELLEISDLLAYSMAISLSSARTRYKKQMKELFHLMSPSLGVIAMVKEPNGYGLQGKPPELSFSLK